MTRLGHDSALDHDPVRLGLVVPGDCHVDDELWRLAAPEAIPYVTRTRGASDTEMAGDAIAEVLGLAEGPEIGAAAVRLSDVAPAAAAYVDTSISFVRGVGGDLEIAARLTAALGCPAIVTSTAVVAAFAALGIVRVAAISPYTPDLNDRLVRYFGDQGLEVVAVHALRRTYPGGTTSRELGRYRPAEIVEDAQVVAGDGVDGLFLPCTAVRTLGAIEALERSLGIPVVTAIGATLWAVLRLASVGATREGVGRLLTIEELPAAFRPTADGGGRSPGLSA